MHCIGPKAWRSRIWFTAWSSLQVFYHFYLIFYVSIKSLDLCERNWVFATNNVKDILVFLGFKVFDNCDICVFKPLKVAWSEPVQHVLYIHSVVLSRLDNNVYRVVKSRPCTFNATNGAGQDNNVSCSRNAQVTRKEKLISFQNYKHWYLINTWSDKAFPGTWIVSPFHGG